MRSISRKFCIRLFMLCKISTAILQIFWQRDGKKQTPHFAPTANARCTIFPKLCMVTKLVQTIKKALIIF